MAGATVGVQFFHHINTTHQDNDILDSLFTKLSCIRQAMQWVVAGAVGEQGVNERGRWSDDNHANYDLFMAKIKKKSLSNTME